MAKFANLRAAADEQMQLADDVRNSSLVTATRRHEIRSDVGFFGTVGSLALTLLLVGGVVGGGYMGVKSVWNFIHLPTNVQLPSITLPKLPHISMPHVQLPKWLQDLIPHGVQASPTPTQAAQTTATPSVQSTAASGNSTAERERAFISAVRGAVQTQFDDAALLDLGRSACAVVSQGGSTEMMSRQVLSDASRLASQLGVAITDAQGVAQVVANQASLSGLCGN